MSTRETREFSRRHILKAASVAAALCAVSGPTAFAQAGKPKIGMIGSGNVGSNIGKVLASKGYQVMFSSRNLDSDKKLAAEAGPNARAGSPQEAAAFGDVLIFAVPYGALPDLGKTLGSSIKGKVVLDACNPFPARDGEIANKAREKGAGSRLRRAASRSTYRQSVQRDWRCAHGLGTPGTGQSRHADLR